MGNRYASTDTDLLAGHSPIGIFPAGMPSIFHQAPRSMAASQKPLGKKNPACKLTFCRHKLGTACCVTIASNGQATPGVLAPGRFCAGWARLK